MFILRLGLHTFWGWVYLVQTVRFTLLVFGWVDLLYRNLMIVYIWLKPPQWIPLLWMSLCILQTPIFWTILDDECTYV